MLASARQKIARCFERRWVAVLLGAAVALAPLAAQASDPAMVGDWDGPTIHMDWTGQRYTTTEVSFSGERAVVPGDKTARTLVVKNDGPGSGTLEVSVLATQTGQHGSRNPRLAQGINLSWQIGEMAGIEPLSTMIAAAEPQILGALDIAAGGSQSLTIGIDMAHLETEHRSMGVDSTLLDYTVILRMRGALPGPLPFSSGTASGPPGGGGPSAGLATTGADVLPVVLGIGVLLLAYVASTAVRRHPRS